VLCTIGKFEKPLCLCTLELVCSRRLTTTLFLFLCRETRTLLAGGQEAEAQAFINDNAHPRLWRLLAEHALAQLDLPTAEKGFMHCKDIQGLQLVRHLGKLGEKDKQQAEVSLVFQAA